MQPPQTADVTGVAPLTVPNRGALLREQISTLRSLAILSMIMTASRDEAEILRLASTAVAGLAPVTVSGTHLAGSATWPQELDELAGRDGHLAQEAGWRFAFALASPSGLSGYLVVSACAEPAPEQRFLLSELARQTGTALANAAVLSELEEVNNRLAESVRRLESSMQVHEVLTEVAAAGRGVAGIAAAVHQLTGLAAAVEEVDGRVLAWAGPGDPENLSPLDPKRRAALLRHARGTVAPTRDGDRLISLAQSGDDLLGALVLLDPAHTADRETTVILEYGATVLAGELAHRRSFAHLQQSLTRDLVDDLIAGADPGGCYPRAAALGFDLGSTFEVLAVMWSADAVADRLPMAIERAAKRSNWSILLGRRPGSCVVLIHTGGAYELFEALRGELGTDRGCIGVSNPCSSAEEVQRGHREAMLGMAVRRSSHEPDGIARFADLGIFQILWNHTDPTQMRTFIDRWLGPLSAHDAAHQTQLVKTLGVHLDCGGNYDLTAAALSIHRSTLRYRLQRIRECGIDISEPETRLNIHVATRALRVLGAPFPSHPAGA